MFAGLLEASRGLPECAGGDCPGPLIQTCYGEDDVAPVQAEEKQPAQKSGQGSLQDKVDKQAADAKKAAADKKLKTKGHFAKLKGAHLHGEVPLSSHSELPLWAPTLSSHYQLPLCVVCSHFS